MRSGILSRVTIDRIQEALEGFPAGPVAHAKPVQRPQIKQPLANGVFVDWCIANSVRHQHFRREALRCLWREVPLANQPAVRVIVNVDKSRRDDLSSRGDLLRGGDLAERPDNLNLSAGDADIRRSTVTPRAVNQSSIPNHNVEHCCPASLMLIHCLLITVSAASGTDSCGNVQRAASLFVLNKNLRYRTK